MANASVNVQQIVAKWLDSRQKLEEYTKKVEKYKALVQQYMTETGVNKMSGQSSDGKLYKIALSSRARESLSKKDVPSDIWEQYAKASRFRVLTATEERKLNDED